MNVYVKSLNKRTEGEGRDRYTPVGFLGNTMSKHGEDFEDGSKFGQCLISTIRSINSTIAVTKPLTHLLQVSAKETRRLPELKTHMLPRLLPVGWRL